MTDLTSFLKPLFGFLGVIEMIAGLVIIYAGGWTMKKTTKVVLFLCSSVFLMLILFNTRFFYVTITGGETWVLILFIVGCIAVGAILTLLLGKFV